MNLAASIECKNLKCIRYDFHKNVDYQTDIKYVTWAR
jgi:hypothetical protein